MCQFPKEERRLRPRKATLPGPLAFAHSVRFIRRACLSSDIAGAYMKRERGSRMTLNRPCIVTGGFGALGAAVVTRLRADGARVGMIDRAPKPPQWDAIGFGGVDLADPDAAKAAINSAVTLLGGLYALINIAGAFRWETVADGDAATWDLLYSANLKTDRNSTRLHS